MVSVTPETSVGSSAHAGRTRPSRADQSGSDGFAALVDSNATLGNGDEAARTEPGDNQLQRSSADSQTPLIGNRKTDNAAPTDSATETSNSADADQPSAGAIAADTSGQPFPLATDAATLLLSGLTKPNGTTEKASSEAPIETVEPTEVTDQAAQTTAGAPVLPPALAPAAVIVPATVDAPQATSAAVARPATTNISTAAPSSLVAAVATDNSAVDLPVTAATTQLNRLMEPPAGVTDAAGPETAETPTTAIAKLATELVPSLPQQTAATSEPPTGLVLPTPRPVGFKQTSTPATAGNAIPITPDASNEAAFTSDASALKAITPSPHAIAHNTSKHDGADPDTVDIELSPVVVTDTTSLSDRRSLAVAAQGQISLPEAGQQASSPLPLTLPIHNATAQIVPGGPMTIALPATVPVPVNGLAMDIALRAANGESRFEIRLDPAELGRIDVRLDVDKHGQVTSHLTVERPATLDLLRRDAPQLQRALEDAGLKTGDSGLQFSLRDQSSSHRHDDTPGRNTQRLIVTEVDSGAGQMAGKTYSRMLGSSSGIDIRV